MLLVVPTFAVVGLELFGSICLHLGFEIDLLSFALTCKIISKVIIPDHLELRHICCDFRRISLRERLVQLPAIASRMVSLELIAEPNTTHSELIPTNAELYLLETILPTHSQLICTHHSERDSQGSERRLHDVDFERTMKSLTRAIATTVNLTRRHWLVNGKEPTCEALFSLTNDNSVPEDLLLGNVIKIRYAPVKLCSHHFGFDDDSRSHLSQVNSYRRSS